MGPRQCTSSPAPAGASTPRRIVEEDLIALHPALWKAQSLLRMLHIRAADAWRGDAGPGSNDPEGEALKLDLQNAAEVISDLIEQTHEAISALERKEIRCRHARNGGHT
jgi:hypothetical protein